MRPPDARVTRALCTRASARRTRATRAPRWRPARRQVHDRYLHPLRRTRLHDDACACQLRIYIYVYITQYRPPHPRGPPPKPPRLLDVLWATIDHCILHCVFARYHMGCWYAAELHIAPAALFNATYEKNTYYTACTHGREGGFSKNHTQNPLSPRHDGRDRLCTSYLVHIPSRHAVLAMAPAIHDRTQGGPLHRPLSIPWLRVHPTHLWDCSRAEPSALYGPT